MKPSLASTLVVFLAVAAGAAAGYWAAKSSLPWVPARFSERGHSETVTNPVAPALDSRPEGDSLVAGPFHWRQLESRDYKAYIANLRAVGCPEQTIRDIIGAELDHLYAARHEALESSLDQPQHYWQPRREAGPLSHYEKMSKHRELDREKETLLSELLGPVAEQSPSEEPADSPQEVAVPDLRQLPPEVAGRVHEIHEKYMHLREQVFHQNDGRIYPADTAVLKDLQDQRLAELSQILSPEQLREFELREGPIAERLRHELTAFQPTEEEFRAIHEVRQTFSQEYGYEEFDFEDPAYHQAREQVEDQLNDQLKEALGEERFAQYQMSRDPRYRDLYALGERFELPAESVAGMYDLWKTTERQIDQLHADPSFEPQERHQILQAFREELAVEAQQLLGEAAYYNYRNRGGQWMWHLFGEEPGMP